MSARMRGARVHTRLYTRRRDFKIKLTAHLKYLTTPMFSMLYCEMSVRMECVPNLFLSLNWKIADLQIQFAHQWSSKSWSTPVHSVWNFTNEIADSLQKLASGSTACTAFITIRTSNCYWYSIRYHMLLQGPVLLATQNDWYSTGTIYSLPDTPSCQNNKTWKLV